MFYFAAYFFFYAVGCAFSIRYWRDENGDANDADWLYGGTNVRTTACTLGQFQSSHVRTVII